MPPAPAAFAPKAGHEHPDHFGTLRVPPASEINVRQALADGDGVIVTDDPAVIQVLDGFGLLKRTTIPAPRQPAAAAKPERKEA